MQLKTLFFNKIVNNSFWGLVASVIQTLCLSIFFIIISKHFNNSDFSSFIVSSNIYQLVVGFSSLGLGHWFIREIGNNSNRIGFTYRFVKIQILLGLFFYIINLLIVLAIYHDPKIIGLSFLLGINVVFDNFLYALRSLNISDGAQKKTAIIMLIDGFQRMLLGFSLFLFDFSIFDLSLFYVLIRIFTISLFLKIGTQSTLKLVSLIKHKIKINEIREQVFYNWRFVVIVGSSIIFWRTATIIISKMYPLEFVANYEVAAKFFSIFLILPLVISSTVYPKFVDVIRNNVAGLQKVFYISFLLYSTFSIISFAFIQSFAPFLVIKIFGGKFPLASESLQEMFLTFLLMPTVLLQANVMLALKLEGYDARFNFISLLSYVILIFILSQYFYGLAVINYSMFGAFVIFHLMQSFLLIRKSVISPLFVLFFYCFLVALIFGYSILRHATNDVSAFFIVLFISLGGVLMCYKMFLIDNWSPFRSPRLKFLSK